MHLNNAEVVSFNSHFPFLSRELDPQFFSVITLSRESALVYKKYYDWSSMIGIRNMWVVLVGAEAKKKYYNWSSMIGIRKMSVVLVGAEAKKIWKGYAFAFG